MPLPTRGIPIRVVPFTIAPEASGPGPIALDEAHPDDAQPEANNPLPISPVLQKESQWCWAACVEMVMGALESPLPQCEVVTNHFPGPKPAGEPCQHSEIFGNLGCTIPQMSEVWSSLNVNASLVKAVDEGLPPLKFVQLQTEIEAQRPIEVGISWFGGGGHAMIVKGFGHIAGRESVWINDPLGATTRFGSKVAGGEGQILFKDLRAANGFGEWICSWITLSLPEG